MIFHYDLKKNSHCFIKNILQEYIIELNIFQISKKIIKTFILSLKSLKIL